jgi:hypothetical protein
MGLVVIGIYLIIGSLLIFTDWFTVVPDQYRTMAGIVVFAYGALRGVRYYSGNKNE